MRIEQSQVQLTALTSVSRQETRASGRGGHRGRSHSRHTTETETLAFEANGTVQTDDGRQIDFQDKLVLSQQFSQRGHSASHSAPLAATGGGFLFADKNGDGVANDGTELFGPQTGDGFAALAKQDSDGNGWIDQGDPVFSELRVWAPDPNGPGKTYSLADLGIGAIFASGVATPFGQTRSTGIYLTENGEPGIIQQTDLMPVPAA